MTAIGGYTSDVNLNDLQYVGNFPIQNSLGGSGTTTGTTDDYALQLTPALTTAYEPGLPLKVKFNRVNGGPVTLNVDNRGAAPVLKPDGAGNLVPLDANDLNTTLFYILIHDGGRFQVATGISSQGASTASETSAGITRYATTPESNDPANNTTSVTPQKMIAYVSDKVTGLWENKGPINCANNPNYPAGVSGDAYTVSVAGRIGGASGAQVEVRDVIYCVEDNNGGTQTAVGGRWNVIQTNLVQATEAIAGFLKIATQGQTNSGTDDASVITPLKLQTKLDGLLNRNTNLFILNEHMGTVMQYNPGRNVYSVINGNLMVCRDIRLIRVGGPGAVQAWVMNLPKPGDLVTSLYSGSVFSAQGQHFFYSINQNGQLFLTGILAGANDELMLNLNPYIVKFPIEYHDTSPP